MMRKITIEQYGKNGEFITLYVNGILRHGDLTKAEVIEKITKILNENQINPKNLDYYEFKHRG